MVLGIANRTENWKTARCLSPLFGDRAALLARRLGEPQAEKVTLELYWKGARDYCAGKNKQDKEKCRKRLVASCGQFRTLRQKVEAFDGFRCLRPHNYDLSHDEDGRLVNNLLNTEIDIVLESPGRLYIGEAKYKSGFHADGKLVLVHQLVRQYVMAKVLVDVLSVCREVLPFVVTEGGDSAERSQQVRFMIEHGWLDPSHILTWNEVEGLASE